MSNVASASNVLAVHPSFKANNVVELIARGKAKSGKRTYALEGVGTSSHLLDVLFKSMICTQMLHVPRLTSIRMIKAPGLRNGISGGAETVTALALEDY